MDIRLAETKKEILDHLYIRGQVFIIEQEIDYKIEFEGDDHLCDLFVCYIDGAPVGAARLKGNKVGRVATLKNYRYHGIGRALMDYVEQYAKEKGLSMIKLHAQKPVEDFYLKLGYKSEGDIFYEADIPHVLMTKKLTVG
jgi:predicted GNAT family N-acyltransferase